MNDTQQKQLGSTLWAIADKLRGAMNADDFRDYMLSFLFLRYLSDNYEEAVKKELGSDYQKSELEIQKNAEDLDTYIILPHGVLFRGGAEEKIRTKLLKDGNIDAIIGLPANLFFSTGIPVCILVLKKCKKYDDVLIINASEYFEKGKRQNTLLPDHIDKIIETYQYRKEDDKKYSRRVSMEEIEKNGYNLNISRYVSTAPEEEIVDIEEVRQELEKIENDINVAKARHNEFLKELGLNLLP